MILHVGIDEAGLGPVLGPMGLVFCASPGKTRRQAQKRFADCGLRDSKLIHRPHDLRPLEGLVWPLLECAFGRPPATAAELFALFGEHFARLPAEAREAPWLAAAADFSLPCSLPPEARRQAEGDDWLLLGGRLIHAWDFNHLRCEGLNRSAVELHYLQALLQQLPPGDSEICVDRLGGRKFYSSFLATVWPQAEIVILAENADCSRYQVKGEAACRLIEFRVAAESHCPLVAAASCVAKYLREIHMQLLNRYWCGRYPWLRPTAGYPQDAKRWLFQLGSGVVSAYRSVLVRDGSNPDKVSM